MSSSSSASSSGTAQWRYRVTNVEYTEFERLGMADSSIDEASTQSVFPANTNVLYVGLQVRAGAAAMTRGAGLLMRAFAFGMAVSSRHAAAHGGAWHAFQVVRGILLHEPASPPSLPCLLVGGGACGARQHGSRVHGRGAAWHDPQHRQGGGWGTPACCVDACSSPKACCCCRLLSQTLLLLAMPPADGHVCRPAGGRCAALRARRPPGVHDAGGWAQWVVQQAAGHELAPDIAATVISLHLADVPGPGQLLTPVSALSPYRVRTEPGRLPGPIL